MEILVGGRLDFAGFSDLMFLVLAFVALAG
jgi:hypothetical protein